jgi:hypothetical protein
MAADDVTLENLGEHMFVAAKSSFRNKSNNVTQFLKDESEKLAATLRMIIESYMLGKITESEARILLNQQKAAASAVLKAAEGMTLVAAQAAVNASLKVARDLVNSKIGFPLL